MARKTITDLLDEELTESESTEALISENHTQLPTEIFEKTPKQNVEGDQSKTLKDSDSEIQSITESVTNKVPKYLSLERKEVRLPSEHIDELTRLVRSLNRQRKGKDERITENTLIRIGVSLLVDFGEKISGNNEMELLESLRKAIKEKNS